MLTAEEIYARLRHLGPEISIRILAAMEANRAFEAERIVLEQYGDNRADEAMELIASMARETKGNGS